MTAPANIANVLNVPMSVCAQEKSIVPWAWTAVLVKPASASVSRFGHFREATRQSFLYTIEVCGRGRLKNGVWMWDLWTQHRRDISTSTDWSSREYAETYCLPNSPSNTS
jgi:hypothetical protein